MIPVEIQYYNLNRILLLIIGLWPYQQSKFVQVQFIFFFAILLTGIIFQLTPLIILKCTSELVAKVLSSVSFFTLFTIQYIAVHFNIDVVKNLLVELQHIFNDLRDENEIGIVEKYSCVAKRYTVVLTAIVLCTIFAIILAQFWSNITDINGSTNTSRHHLFIMTKYFVNQEKYFYLILLHMVATLCIGITIMLGIGTMVITYIEHTCGMFRIASYRFDYAVNINILHNSTIKNMILMTEGIIYAIDIHRQAMKLSKHVVSTFEVTILCFTGCAVVCFSLNVFQLFQITSENNVNEFLLPCIYAFISILYMFIANYVGQNIIDHNKHIFITAYNVQWYRTPLHTQRLILFLLQRGAQEFSLNISGLLDASIEGFATLVKTAVSYFTVMHSVQNKH